MDPWANNPYRSPFDVINERRQRSMQMAIPLLMEKKRMQREDQMRKEQLTAAAQAAEQKRLEDEQKLRQKAFETQVKYTQDMMKTAYEKGDTEGVQAFGTPLAGLGYAVPGEQVAGPSQPGQLPPMRFWAAPQKQGMSEAELTQRAMSGDKTAQAVLNAMTERKKQTAAAGASNVAITNEIGEKSMTRLGEEMSKDLVGQRKDVIGAVNGLTSLKEAEKLLDGGMITGTGAEWIVNFNNFLSSRLGFNQVQDPVANTQAFAATMGTQVGQIIKQFGSGTGLSDADREYAEKIVGGKITMNEATIRKLFKINKKAYENVIKNYNKMAGQAMSKQGSEALPYDLRVDYDFEEDKKEQKDKPRFKIIKVE